MGPRFRPSCHHHAYRPLYPEKTRPFGKPRRLNLHCEVIVRLPGIIGVRSSAPPCLTELQPFPATIRAASIGGAVIGALGGLIGLGGAEFRLPLLIGLFRFGALQTVILNKTMSLVVVATALPFRAAAIPFSAVASHWTIIVNLLAGSLSVHGSVPTRRRGSLRKRFIASSRFCWSALLLS